jgi:hypothetical protein
VVGVALPTSFGVLRGAGISYAFNLPAASWCLRPHERHRRSTRNAVLGSLASQAPGASGAVDSEGEKSTRSRISAVM